MLEHFREEDIEYMHRVPNGDGSYREMPRSRPKLKEGAVPAILPGCPLYYSSHSTNKRSRLSLECKDDELLNQAVTLSLRSEVEEDERFKIQSFQELQDKLSFLSIHKTWSLWYPDESNLIIMRPGFHNRKIEVDAYLSVEFDLPVKAYFKGEMFSISQVTLSDIQQLVSILDDISNPPSIDTEKFPSSYNNASHIASAERHLQQIIDNMH